jgi:hypothetical protein
LFVELSQVGGFVLLALTPEEVGVVFRDVGASAVAAGDFEGQRGEVWALDVVVEVRGGKDEAITRRLDHCIWIIPTGALWSERDSNPCLVTVVFSPNLLTDSALVTRRKSYRTQTRTRNSWRRALEFGF